MKALIHKHKDSLLDTYYVNLPATYMKELGWEEGDEVLLEKTLDCYVTGEITSIVVGNVTKHPEIHP
jgi:hypothetical protein